MAVTVHDELISPDGLSYEGVPILSLPPELRLAVQQRHMQRMVANASAAKGETKAAAKVGVRAEGKGPGSRHAVVNGHDQPYDALLQTPGQGKGDPVHRGNKKYYPGEAKEGGAGISSPVAEPAAEAKTEQGVVEQPRPRVRLQGRPDLMQPVPPVTPPPGAMAPGAGYIPTQAITNTALAQFGTADPGVLRAAHQQALGDYANWYKTQDLSQVPMPQAQPQIPMPPGSQGPLPEDLYQQGLGRFGGKPLTVQDMDNRANELVEERKRELARQEQGQGGGPLHEALGGAFRAGLRSPPPPLPPQKRKKKKDENDNEAADRAAGGG